MYVYWTRNFRAKQASRLTRESAARTKGNFTRKRVTSSSRNVSTWKWIPGKSLHPGAWAVRSLCNSSYSIRKAGEGKGRRWNVGHRARATSQKGGTIGRYRNIIGFHSTGKLERPPLWFVFSLENAQPSRDSRPTYAPFLCSALCTLPCRPCFAVTFLSFLLLEKEETTTARQLRPWPISNGWMVWTRSSSSRARFFICHCVLRTQDRSNTHTPTSFYPWTVVVDRRRWRENGNELLRFSKRSMEKQSSVGGKGYQW